MPRCPFCKEFSYGETGPYICGCGEALPEMVYNYRRERCICGKTVEFQPMEFNLNQMFPASF
ncbi:MAG: hypothetical protein GKC03_00225 [Methanomassiliicoccales archaeon]|nr:hypothetical protein [Methanomassiliicoccales archaeon]NYT15018.1 hypothetical protein [Methanomassiliicoccales archaeon]